MSKPPKPRGAVIPEQFGGGFWTEPELEALGIDVREFLRLSAAAQNDVITALAQTLVEGESQVQRDFTDADYRLKPVSMEQFLSDDQFFGGYTQELYPLLRNFLIELYDSATRPPVEIILGGSLGWGKSTCAGLGLSYFAYRVACLRDPNRFYHLMPGAKIIIGLYSVSILQAQDTIFGKMINWFDNSPFFQANMRRDKRYNARISLQGTPMQIITGSRTVHTLGRDMIAFALDEANFINAKNTVAEDQGLAYDIYNNAQKRLKSRFGTRDDSGDVLGQVWLISSKRSKASFLENHVKVVRKDIDAGVTRLLEYARWDVEPGADKMKRFRLEVGDRINPTRLLKLNEPPRPGAQVLQVPEKYRKDFVLDADSALRDLAGLATDSLSPLIGDVTTIDKCITTQWRHPFRRPTVEISIKDKTPIEDFFEVDAVFKIHGGVYVPRRHPTAPRFIHVDIGLTTDPLGISCCHIAGLRQIRRTRSDGTYHDEPCPIIDVDFMLQVTPPRGSEIDLGAVRAFIVSLRDLGMPIFRISTDSTYGRDFMQIMLKIDFDACLLSVDRSPDAYLSLRSAIYEERIRFYDYLPFRTELVDLERDVSSGKIDHPRISPSTGAVGTKDVADSLAGAAWLALIDKDAAMSGSLPGDHLDDASVGVRTAHGSVSWSELDRELSKELG